MAPVFSVSVRRRTWIVAPAEQKAPKKANMAPEGRPGRQVAGRTRRLQIGREHDEDADETDADGRPAVGAHRLLEHERRQDDGDQRRGVADGDGVVAAADRTGRESPRTCRSVPMKPAQEMPRHVLRAHRVDEVALPAQPNEQRQQGEGGAEEDELARRDSGR